MIVCSSWTDNESACCSEIGTLKKDKAEPLRQQHTTQASGSSVLLKGSVGQDHKGSAGYLAYQSGLCCSEEICELSIRSLPHCQLHPARVCVLCDLIQAYPA